MIADLLINPLLNFNAEHFMDINATKEKLTFRHSVLFSLTRLSQAVIEISKWNYPIGLEITENSTSLP